MTRADVLEATGPNPGAFVRAKIGVTKKGRITAAEGYVAMEGGAYPGAFVAGALVSMFIPYDIPNVAIDAYDVLNNKPKSAPYRAPELFDVPPDPDGWNELHFPPEYTLSHYEMSHILPHLIKDGRGTLDVYFTRVFNPVWTYPDGFSWMEMLQNEQGLSLIHI